MENENFENVEVSEVQTNEDILENELDALPENELEDVGENENAEILPEDGLEVDSVGSEIVPTDETENISDSSVVISSEDFEIAVYNALEKWTEESTGQILVQSGSSALERELSSFTLTEFCLVGILLILLAQSILKIIGGKAWDR